MKKINKHIEIVRSTASGLSSMSQVSAESILAVLRKHYTNVDITIVNDLSDLEAIVESQPDLVFLGMEFIPSISSLGRNDPTKIWLSDYFDEHSITYTGSDQTAHQFERDKPLAKQRILGAGLKTAAFFVARRSQELDMGDVTLNFPLFVKPTNRGGGLGIDSASVVHTLDQLRDRIDYVTNALQSDALVEELLPGREFSVAILKDEFTDQYHAMPLELVAPLDNQGNRLLGSQVKSANAEQVLEVTDETMKPKLTALALAAFYALGARDYGRIDIRCDASGQPHFLEANLIPSLISGYGSFPKACQLNIDLGYEPMIQQIVKLGLNRPSQPTEDRAEGFIFAEQSV